jgi:hypothetical protein
MPRWQNLLRREAIARLIQETMRNARSYAYPWIPRQESPDAASPIEQLEPRLLLSASVEGIVYGDLDNNAVMDATDPGMASWTVYHDANLNRQLDTGEAFTLTDATGRYRLDHLESGHAQIGMIVPAGYRAAGGSSTEIALALDPNAGVPSVDFGLTVTEPTVMALFTDTTASSVSLSLKDPASLHPGQWRIAWGDGTATSIIKENVAESFQHTFSKKSSYEISLEREVDTHWFSIPVARIGHTSALGVKPTVFTNSGFSSVVEQQSVRQYQDGVLIEEHADDSKL